MLFPLRSLCSLNVEFKGLELFLPRDCIRNNEKEEMKKDTLKFFLTLFVLPYIVEYFDLNSQIIDLSNLYVISLGDLVILPPMMER